MSLILPPAPLTGIEPLDRWLAILWRYLQAIPWSVIDYSGSVSTATGDTTLTDSMMTVLVTVSGATITLPTASTARTGRAWNVIFGTTGTCTVTTQGGDSFPAPTSATETSVILNQRGQSVIMRCTSATTWGID